MCTAPLESHTPSEGAPIWQQRVSLNGTHPVRDGVVGSDQPIAPLLPLQHESVLGLAEALGDARNRIEHGLHVKRRAAYDLEHIGCSSLSLMRFAQLSLELRDPVTKVFLCPGSRYLRRHGIHPIV